MGSRSSSRAQPEGRGREIGGIVLLAIGLFLVAAISSVQFGEGRLMGPLGRFAGLLVHGAVGVGALIFAAAMIVAAVRTLAGRPPVRSIAEGAGLALGLLSLAALAHLVGRGWRKGGIAAGGRIG